MHALPVIAAGASIVGTGLSAYGQYKAGQAQAQAYEVNAQRAERTAQEEERTARIRLRKLMSTQKAMYAKAGVDITSGSPLMVMFETEYEGEKEIEAIRRTGSETAEQERLYGKQASTAGLIGAGSTLLTGLGSTGMNYYAKKKLK